MIMKRLMVAAVRVQKPRANLMLSFIQTLEAYNSVTLDWLCCVVIFSFIPMQNPLNSQIGRVPKLKKFPILTWRTQCLQHLYALSLYRPNAIFPASTADKSNLAACQALGLGLYIDQNSKLKYQV
jgi:hypothetical protein